MLHGWPLENHGMGMGSGILRKVDPTGPPCNCFFVPAAFSFFFRGSPGTFTAAASIMSAVPTSCSFALQFRSNMALCLDASDNV